MAKSKAPKKIVVEPVHARVIRGPNPEGRWYWRGEVYRGDESHTVYRGWKTREEAHAEVVQLVNEGKVERPIERQKGDLPITVDLVVDRWLGAQKARKDLAPRTTAAYQVCTRHLVEELRGIDPQRVEKHVLEGYRDRRIGAGAAGRTVQAELQVLGQVWRWALDYGAVPAKRLPTVKIVVRPVRSRYRPSPGEIARVIEKLEAAHDMKWPVDCLRLLAATGARISEVAAHFDEATNSERPLQWRDIDLRSEVFHVSGKTGGRDVPLGAWVIGRLRALRAKGASEEDEVWPVTPNVIRKHLGPYVKAACKLAKVPYFTNHCLRRGAVDQFARGREDAATAAAFLGHSVQTMLEMYRDVTREDQRDALERVRLGELPAGDVVDLEEARRRRHA